MIISLYPKWITEYSIRTSGVSAKTSPITLLEGVFQGDTLSVLLFCLSMSLVSHALKMEHDGIDVPFLKDVSFNHLFYVDDLKCYALSNRKMDVCYLQYRGS